MFKVVFQSIQNWFKGVAHVFVMKILMANIEEVLFCIDMTISYFVCQFGFLFSFSLLYVQYFKKNKLFTSFLTFSIVYVRHVLKKKKIHSGTNLIMSLHHQVNISSVLSIRLRYNLSSCVKSLSLG